MAKPNGSRQVDMLHGPMAKKIMMFAMPIAAISILQQLFNSVDVAVVGHYVGTGALAAVGTNTPVISLFINCMVSLSVGATVSISHMIGLMEADGEDRSGEIRKMIHTAVLFSILCGTCITILGLLIASPVLKLMGAPSEILADAVLYLKIYFLATPFIMVYNFLAAILRSVGDTRRPLYVLVASGVLNVVLNVFLVVVMHRGVDGVAIATVISNIFSAAILWILMMREQELIRLYPSRLAIEWKHLKRLVQIGGPASLQGMFFCFSNMCLQSGINSLGADAIAAAAAAQICINVAFYFVTGFNQAALAFAGQNYGAGEWKRCKKVLVISLLEAIGVVMSLIVLMMVLRYPMLSLFTSDAYVTELAIVQMVICLCPYFLVCGYEITGAWLRAMGHSLEPALVVVIGSVCFRILWLETVFRKIHTYEMLFVVYPASWIITICIMTTVAIVLMRRDRAKHTERLR